MQESWRGERVVFTVHGLQTSRFIYTQTPDGLFARICSATEWNHRNPALRRHRRKSEWSGFNLRVHDSDISTQHELVAWLEREGGLWQEYLHRLVARGEEYPRRISSRCARARCRASAGPWKTQCDQHDIGFAALRMRIWMSPSRKAVCRDCMMLEVQTDANGVERRVQYEMRSRQRF
jgi:hypothetical protein